MSPLQNACGAGQRQAKAAGKRTSAFQKSYSDLAKRCRQRVDGSDVDSLDTGNFPGVLLLSITATSATGDFSAWQPVCTSHSGRVLQNENMMSRSENYSSHMLLDMAKKQDLILEELRKQNVSQSSY